MAAHRIARVAAGTVVGMLTGASSMILAQAQPPVRAGNVGSAATFCEESELASPYIPVDSWVYPAVLRLYSLGYVNDVFLDMRPWTRASLSNMLQDTADLLRDADNGAAAGQASEIYDALQRFLHFEAQGNCAAARGEVNFESAYSVVRGISGTPLDDSLHLGSTVVNDYGRPYQNGFNLYSGASGYATAGRFTFYARGEFQGAPSARGYSPALMQTLATIDQSVDPATGQAYPNQLTIPGGSIGTVTRGRILEAYVSAQILNHVISFGKQDQWLGPAEGASMAYSNNAEDIYAFEINRIEPLYVPLLSKITGPFRYEFLIGELKGHSLMLNPLYANNPSDQPNVISPGNPWVHVEKLSFHPTENLEFGFERTAIFGGEGHSPVTLHTFLKSFLSTVNVTQAIKNGRSDPGARFGAFDFSYRLPFVRNWLTIYTDSEAHDDVSPIDAPRRASLRPGLFLSHVPGLARLDLRVEGVSTDPPTSRSVVGTFMYWEGLEKQGYTNQGQLFGDWAGREDKGGQGWATYHLKGNEWVQASWRHQKAAKDFIPGGTTLNDFAVQVAKRIEPNLEVRGTFDVERWKAPVYKPAPQTVTATTIQLTWYPDRKLGF